MRRRMTLLLVASGLLGALVWSCVGDDPALIVSQDRDGGSSEGSTGGGGARDSSIDDVGPSPTGDASADASEAGTSCGTSDTTPCECGPGKTCCVFADGRSSCQARGNEDEDAGCSSTNIIRCVAGTCAPGQVCCFNGAVGDDDVCPKRLALFDSECVSVSPDAPESACVDLSNSDRHLLMCRGDEDCAAYDAGTCQPARMDHVGRVMGICVR